MKRQIKICLSLLGVAILMAACGGRKATDDRRVVSVTIEPVRYFAERIAGETFQVHCVVPSGQSPETYDPTPRQMAFLGESVAYLRIGAIGFEMAWMETIQQNNPTLRVFDLSDGIQLLESPDEDEDEEEAEAEHHHGEAEHHHSEAEHHHSEAEHHHHHHGGVDPHTWSSISGAKQIAKNILDAFVRLDPTQSAAYNANYQTLLAEIEATEQTVSALLTPLRGEAFIIYHPALTYLAAEYGLEQLCIELDGKEPSPAQLKRLVEAARTHNARVVFVQQEFDQKNAQLIAEETGCRLVSINPLSADWQREMIFIAKTLAHETTD